MRYRIASIVALLIGIAAPWIVPEYAISLLSYTGLAALVATGLVLLTGIAGQSSFGQAAFVGIGAYTTAYLSRNLGLSPYLGLIAGLVLTGIAAWLLGLITVRLSGHYLPLGTVAWGISFYYFFVTADFLGKFNGMAEIPDLSVFGHPITDRHVWLYLIWIVMLLALWLAHNLLESRHGRVIRALNGGRLMAESMGIDTDRANRALFVLAALYAGLAGWLFAHFQRFVNPTPFSLTAGIEYLFMVIVGGAGWLWGAVLGAGVVTILRDQLNDLLPRLIGRPGNYETVVFAAAVILLLQRAPQGLWPVVRRIAPMPARKLPPIPEIAEPPTQRATITGPVLQLKGVTKRFGGLVANNAISFTVQPGEILAVIGPNGAGKSTLFNLVSGVLAPDGGTIRLFGDETQGLTARSIARRGVARTFQHVRLMADRNVLENVALGMHQRGHAGMVRALLHLERAEESRLLAEAARQIRRVGLGDRMGDAAGALPLGQQRVVEIARALCLDPRLLLLDEPAAGLRHQEKRLLAELLRTLQAEGVTILLVEHDMEFVMGLADRVVVMDFGQKIAEGRPEQVQRDPVVLEAYLGGIE